MFKTNKVPAIEERTVSGSSVSFNSAFALPLKACKVSFSATQAGSGDPSPSNPRAISGVSAIGLNANSTPVSVSLGNTRYGGELDLLTGELTINYTKIVFKGTEIWNIYGNMTGYYVALQDMKKGRYNDGLSDKFEMIRNNSQFGIMLGYDNKIAYFCQINQNISEVTDLATWKTWLSNNNVELVYPLAEPITVQLSANELSSIIGNNTFSTDTGTLEITFADLQEKSASGAVATFNTALAMPLASCNIAVNAWQEGTGDPSPDNDRPIHGFSKVNLVNSRIVPVNKLIPITATQEGSGEPSPTNIRPIHAGLTIVRDDDTTLDIYGGTLDVASGELSVTKKIVYFDDVTGWKYNEQYNRFYTNVAITDYSQIQATDNLLLCDILVTSTDSVLPSIFIDAGGNRPFVRNIGVTTVEDFLSIVSGHYLVCTIKPKVIQLSVTELQRAKEALGIITTTIDLNGTRYGGSLDLVSGVMTVNKKLINAKEQIWILQAAGISVYTATDTDNSITSEYPTGRRPIMSNAFVYSNNASILNHYCGWGGSNNNKNLFVRYDELTTSLENWDTFINANDIEFVYYIEPFTVQLTPTQIETLIGNNTIFADTGDVDLTYKDLDIAKRGNFREVFKLPS